MGDEDDGLLQHALQAHEFGLHLAADQRIERRERLVEKPDFRLDRERARNADALLLAAGKFGGKPLLAALEAHEIDHLPRAGLALFPADALDEQREGHVVEHVQMRQQREVLEHHAHLVAADLDQLVLAGAQQILAVENEFAHRRFDQPRQAAHQRRLARARKPHDDEDLALAHLERGVAHGADQMSPIQVGTGHLPLALAMKARALGPNTFHRFRQDELDRARINRARFVFGHVWSLRAYCAQAFHLASLASTQAFATSSMDLPSRSTSPDILFSSLTSI